MSNFTTSYNRLLGNRVALSIIKMLSLIDHEMTGREVASNVGYSPQTVLESLNELGRLSIVASKKAGRAKLYSINNQHWFISRVLVPIWEEIDGWLRELGKYYADKFKPKPVSIIMYGSFAREEATFESDLDLLFIYKDRQYVTDLLDKILSFNPDIVARYGVHASPKIVSVSEFKNSVKNKEGFMRNIFLEGKSIYGLTPSEVLSYDSKKA
jgi:predicted nucleotidyltransferase